MSKEDENDAAISRDPVVRDPRTRPPRTRQGRRGRYVIRRPGGGLKPPARPPRPDPRAVQRPAGARPRGATKRRHPRSAEAQARTTEKSATGKRTASSAGPGGRFAGRWNGETVLVCASGPSLELADV